MKLTYNEKEEAFRSTLSKWLCESLKGEFAKIRFRGGPGDEHSYFELRQKWEKHLAKSGYTGIAWPKEYGGLDLNIGEQVIFYEEYAKAGGPGRVGHIGEGLLAPTLIAYGTKAQKEKYLPGILSGSQLWCQGYSEPDAGSDLANIKTKAHYDPQKKEWRLNGQKVWTSLAMHSDFCFVLARTDKSSKGHKGLGFFLVKMDQPGVRVVPIKQLTGTSEFCEVFLSDAICPKEDLLGGEGDGWRIAMSLLGFERGVSTLGQQMLFQNELNQIVKIAKENGKAKDPIIRQRLAKAKSELLIMRANSLRVLSLQKDGSLTKEGLIYKLFWSTWHRELGELCMDVLADEAEILKEHPYKLSALQSLFLFTRSDTIYGGTNQIQRNIIAERGLSMPKEKRAL